MGRPGEAAELYRRLIELDHATALTHAKLGECLFQSARYAEAARAYRSALELHRERKEAPLPFSVWLQLGEALEKQGRGDKALETYREAQRLYSELPPQVDSELKGRIENLQGGKEE
jgi:tetratricopeptide (TPR) repeat protein